MKAKTYKHNLKTGHLDEVETVITFFTLHGWEFIDLEPAENFLPTHVLFEWKHKHPPVYPPGY